MRVTIVGFGLIGGSVARALHARPDRAAWQVSAWSRRAEPVRWALRDGVVEAAPETLEAAIDGADLVVLAAPPRACLDLLGELGGPLRSALGEASLTDVASTKSVIVARADRLRLHFVGGHPMAGREAGGYAASQADLFLGRPWVTVAGSCARLLDGDRVRELVEACGAIQVPLEARAHDQAVAAISHLPLVVSAALVETIVGGADEPERADWPVAASLAATGWAGMTRLARGDPTMGGDIAATNAAALAARIRELRGVLDSWLAELDAASTPDRDEEVARRLGARFEAARRRLGEGSM